MATQFQRELPRDLGAPRLARRTVEKWFGPSVEGVELARITLLTTELVTNALLHGAGTITLCGRLDDERVVVEVIDEGEGFQPRVKNPALAGDAGLGLAIVEAQANRWGVLEGTARVWFEIALPGERARPDDQVQS